MKCIEIINVVLLIINGCIRVSIYIFYNENGNFIITTIINNKYYYKTKIRNFIINIHYKNVRII